MRKLIPIWKFKHSNLDFLFPFLGYSPKVFKILLAGCNFRCAYCKRSQTGDFSGIKRIKMSNILEKVDKAVEEGCLVEVSGGEACIFPQETLRILKYAKSKRALTAIATNGSFPKRIKKYARYCDAIKTDIKGPKRYIERLTGVKFEKTQKVFETISKLNKENLILNIKVPFFGFTTKSDIKEIIKELKKVTIFKPKMLFTLRLFEKLDYTLEWLTEPTVSYGKKVLEEIYNILQPMKASLVYDDGKNKEHQVFLTKDGWVEYSEGVRDYYTQEI